MDRGGGDKEQNVNTEIKRQRFFFTGNGKKLNLINKLMTVCFFHNLPNSLTEKDKKNYWNPKQQFK